MFLSKFFNCGRFVLSALIVSLLLIISACSRKLEADTLIFNVHIYTVNEKLDSCEAMVIKDGKILALGELEALSAKYSFHDSFNGQDQFIYPAFIDAHTHFYYYALGLAKVNLTRTKSWDSVLRKTKTFYQNDTSLWLSGMGWDQNLWKEKEFPTNEKLNQLFPNQAVVLSRVDGHAVIANEKALSLAGFSTKTKIAGGQLLQKNGKLTGALVDNAASQMRALIPPASTAQVAKALQRAEKEAFSFGLCSVHECGLELAQLLLIDSLQRHTDLKLNIYALLSDDPKNLAWLQHPTQLHNKKLKIGGIKMYADGALGSRGACLLQPYSDQPNSYGTMLHSAAHYDSVATLAAKLKLQLCTHAIGDSANRVILEIYSRHLVKDNDSRWRIEHAQIVHPQDMHYFSQYKIVPSVQPTHATSDYSWAPQRLGAARMPFAYAYQSLLKQNGWLALGTDLPVEPMNPLRTLRAAVFRVDDDGNPKSGFQSSQALLPWEAIRGMTIWAAKAAFQEKERGSLEGGKVADFVMLNVALQSATAHQMTKAVVLATFIDGKLVYKK